MPEWGGRIFFTPGHAKTRCADIYLKILILISLSRQFITAARKVLKWGAMKNGAKEKKNEPTHRT